MDYTIKDLPEDERPREKLEDLGPKNLSEVELLSIILRTGTQGKNVKELSAEILNRYSLEEIANRDLKEMKQFEGISRVKAGQLVAVGELSRRLKKEEKEEIKSLRDVKARVEDMKFMESEILRVFYLNSGNEVISEKEFDGGVSQVDFDAREVLREGLLANASAIILSHNHPSGKACATEKDVETTRELIETCESLGLEVLDHIVVGEDVFSMRRESELRF